MKKMMLILIVLFISINLYACADKTTPGLIFSAVEELNGYEVTSYTGADTVVHIPDKFEGYDVIGIAKEAFKDKLIKEIYIANNIEYIDDYAFYNTVSLEKIKFSNKSELTVIGNNAFSMNISLTEIVLPNKLTSIGFSAFEGCENVINIQLPKSLIEIGENAFYRMKSLNEIFIPRSVETIGEAAFDYMENLEYIHVDESNEYFKSIDGVLYSKDVTILYRYPYNKLDYDFTVPEQVKVIMENALVTKNLVELTIQYPLEKISTFSVYGMKLEKIFILDYIDVIEIGGFLKSPTEATIYVYLSSKPDTWANAYYPNVGWNGRIEVVWDYKS